MEIKISQVVAKMPEKKTMPDCECIAECICDTGWLEGRNSMLEEVSSLPIDKDKVIDLVEFDREKLAKNIFNRRQIQLYGEISLVWEESVEHYKNILGTALSNAYELADAIIASKSDILTIKGDV